MLEKDWNAWWLNFRWFDFVKYWIQQFSGSLTLDLQDKRQLCQCADALFPCQLCKGKGRKKLFEALVVERRRSKQIIDVNLIDFLLSRAELPLKMNGNDLWCGIMFKQKLNLRRSKAQKIAVDFTTWIQCFVQQTIFIVGEVILFSSHDKVRCVRHFKWNAIES